MNQPLSGEAKRQMRLFAERCNGGDPKAAGAPSAKGQCKSCTFLLAALDEIDRLNAPRVLYGDQLYYTSS